MPAEIFHIYPVDDLEEHHIACDFPLIGPPCCHCKCKPLHKEDENGLYVIHNSFDGREGVEWFYELLRENANG